MQFNSLEFVWFLPLVFVLYWLLPFRFRWLLLLVASYYFYMSPRPLYGLLLAATTLVDFYAAARITQSNNPEARKRWLWLSVGSNLGSLFVFKYLIFFYNSAARAAGYLSGNDFDLLDKIIVPAGLSFYTFQSLSYTIDVYRNQAVPSVSPARFALYVSFFPQLVAGPVERYTHLMPQLYEKHKLTIERLVSGVRIATWGFFKKMVIADRLAVFVDPVFADTHSYSGLTLLIAGFFFVVQVYCDFSGYSDIATGVARLFGFELMLNWRRPLLSRSLREFWTRNHISMTTWFRDYVYKPLGGNRCPYRRWLINIFLVFLISGFWHGANWTFLIWGAMHGTVYVLELLLGNRLSFFRKISWLGWIYLILFHAVSLIAFRAQSAGDLWYIYSQVFSFDWDAGLALHELRSIGNLLPLTLSLLFIAFLFMKELNEEYAVLNRLKGYESIMKPLFYVFLFVMIFVFGQFNANEFIYFHF